MATFAQRISEFIGSDYSTIAANSNTDLFNAAVSEVADLAPPELLLKYAVGPILLDNGTPTWTSVEGRKVLLVVRLDASGGVERECMPVSIEDFALAKDATSIYLATKHSPVFAYTTTGGDTSLSIYPVPTASETAKIYYFAYTSISDLAVSTITGLPNEIEQAVVLKACINILQAYISDFVQEEEDSEMQSMINAQIQSLTAQYRSELSRFTEQDATPRGE